MSGLDPRATRLAPADQARPVAIGVGWDAPGLDCDLVAFALADGDKVPLDSAFVFFNNLATPAGLVLLRQPSYPPAGVRHRAQVFVDLNEPGPQIRCVTIAFATMTEGKSLSAVRNLQVDVLDLSTGRAAAGHIEPGIVHTSCIVLADLRLHAGAWHFVPRSESRPDGLAGLASSLGVNLA